MRKLIFTITLVGALVLTAVEAHAAKLGDPAKPLVVSEWIKNGPVDLAKGKGKNIYVIEFWATWCPPCRASIPHLTALQKKYKDKGLIAVGISTEDSDVIRAFVKKEGDQMDYAVARDDNEKTTDAYMLAFHQDGIPTAFVVDKQGAIVWLGHPLDPELERVIEKLVNGTFNLKQSIKETQETKAKQAHFMRYFQLASAGTDKKAADKEAAWLMEKGANDPDLLTHLALHIQYAPGLKYRDEALARRAATRAYQLTKGKDPIALHVYARALFDAGKVDEAIKYQKQAIAVNTNPNFTRDLQQTLSKYEAAKAAPQKKK